MSEPQPPTTAADRYGTAGPRRRPGEPLGRRARAAIVVALVLAVAAVAWYTAMQQRDDPISAEMLSFDAVDAERIDAAFQVHMPPGTTAVCTIEALAPSYAQVGTVDVAVGPAETRTSAYEITIGTSQLATTAVVADCTRTEG